MRSKLVKIKRSILVNFILTLSRTISFGRIKKIFDIKGIELQDFKNIIFLAHSRFFNYENQKIILTSEEELARHLKSDKSFPQSQQAQLAELFDVKQPTVSKWLNKEKL